MTGEFELAYANPTEPGPIRTLFSFPNPVNEVAARLVAAACTIGFLGQFSGCQFDELTVTQTVDARELVISLVREAVLGPIDDFLTVAINDAFEEE